MKLYFIHCGFYEEEISEGIYEFHVNIPVAAESVDAAKLRVRDEAVFRRKKMHIDGIQEISSVSGFEVRMVPRPELADGTSVTAHLHRDF